MMTKKILLIGALLVPILTMAQQNVTYGGNGQVNYLEQNQLKKIQFLKNQHKTKQMALDASDKQSRTSKGIAGIADREAKDRLQGVHGSITKEHSLSKTRAMAEAKVAEYKNDVIQAKVQVAKEYQDIQSSQDSNRGY